MVTLLVFVYKSDQKIPTKPIEFYESLFPTVLSRHDKTKPGGVNRNRKTRISDTSFQKVFDCISFLTSQDSKTSFKKSEIVKHIDKAKSYSNEVFDSDDYLTDVCKITCLILRDGFDYNYLHKSIQEYHAARFIASIPESKVIEFYGGILAAGKWRKWQEQIAFLNELDSYRCKKYFILASCYSARASLFSKNRSIKRSIISSFLTNFQMGINVNSESDVLQVMYIHQHGDSELYMLAEANYVAMRHISVFIEIINGYKVKRSTLDDENFNSFYSEQSGRLEISLGEYLKLIGKDQEFSGDYSVAMYKYIDNILSSTSKIIDQLESTDALFDL